MAPQARPPRENNYLFDLGVKGRKTGITLPDTGIRDENGMEPMDHLFSSPEKPKAKSSQKATGARKNHNTTISSEEDMEVGDSTIPEPTAVITERKRASMRLPPRSKSPIKTFLQSPARRNPSLGPVSSPVRGSIVAPAVTSISKSVARKLDFSNNSFDEASSPQKRARSAMPVGRPAKLTNGAHLAPARQAFSENGDTGDDSAMLNGEDDYPLLNGGDDDEVEQVERPDEEEPEPVPAPELPTKKGKGGRPKKQDLPIVQQEEERPSKRTRQSLEGPPPVKNKLGRRKKTAVPEVESEEQEEEQPQPAKIKPGRQKKTAAPEEEPEEQEEERPAKRSRRSPDTSEASKLGRSKKTSTSAGPVAKPSKEKAKSTSQKPPLATISEADSPQVQRGPPMPRTNRGLVILRRETPMEGNGFKQTRSGRNSIKPLAYWKNERVEYTEEAAEDGRHFRFLLPKIKEVVRADDIEEPKRKKTYYKPSKSKKRRAEPESEDDEDEMEAWETEPGHMFGEIRTWDPEDPLGSQSEERQAEIALSAAAIITRDIPGGSFKFAKTLTNTFFGSGVVDLPVGAAKLPKNTRKMHMVFFVHTGRVKVSVNDTEFRIGKGGQWQVPRGNYYSIENDYDQPARIFFAQGCELEYAEG